MNITKLNNKTLQQFCKFTDIIV